jgi:hypothetical protein
MSPHLVDEDRGKDRLAISGPGGVRQHTRSIGSFQRQEEQQGFFTGPLGRRQQDFAEQTTVQDAGEFFP